MGRRWIGQKMKLILLYLCESKRDALIWKVRRQFSRIHKLLVSEPGGHPYVHMSVPASLVEARRMSINIPLPRRKSLLSFIRAWAAPFEWISMFLVQTHGANHEIDMFLRLIIPRPQPNKEIKPLYFPESKLPP
jgi:hypothetical protein